MPPACHSPDAFHPPRGFEPMAEPISFVNEPRSNDFRKRTLAEEPISQRTFTPTQAVLAKSAGLYHWTADGRKLADFTSGVLVANLGHNPRRWMQRFAHHLQWTADVLDPACGDDGYVALPPLTTYNAISTLEAEANDRLLASLRATEYGAKMQQVLWSASGSEGVQKALWSCLALQPTKDVILATRHGFHGKKGLSEAITGDEHSANRDARVVFISFPKTECDDLTLRDQPFDVTPYRRELEDLKTKYAGRLNCLCTEPYLGGGGSFHPPRAYLQMLVEFCNENGVTFLLDEVQANFGRTGEMYAFEKYQITPDLVVLGKGMGNGVPVNAVVGRSDVFAAMPYGGASDTWSAHPMGCAATLATLDVFESDKVMDHVKSIAPRVEAHLLRLKELGIVRAVRGEGMVYGIEFQSVGGEPAGHVANACVRQAYLGDDAGNAIHLLGPLAGKVVRISPPLTMTVAEIDFWFAVLYNCFAKVDQTYRATPTLAAANA
ncbi:MAG: aminotransferase class III-fold pyridoxal phosphate-dependent enzyme [Planctomycetia bacterium]